jgi:hypothetical protein
MDRDVRKYLGFCNYSSGTQFHHPLYRLVFSKDHRCRWRRLYYLSKLLNSSGIRFLNRVFRNQRERFRQQGRWRLRLQRRMTFMFLVMPSKSIHRLLFTFLRLVVERLSLC